MSQDEKLGDVSLETIEFADVSHLTDKTHWWKQPGLRELYLKVLILFLGATTLGYDASLLNGLQAMPTWQKYFHNPSSSLLGIYVAMIGFGGLAALLFAPYLADHYGRIPATAIGNVVIILGSILQTFPPASHPKSMFLAGRFFMGFGSFITTASCPLLITELAHPRHRGKLTTMYNTLFFIGALCAAWGSLGTLLGLSTDLQWRLPTALQCVMPGIQLLLLYTIPESPRFHLSRGQPEKARQTLVKYHGNGTNTRFVQWELQEISQTLQYENSAAGESGWKTMINTAANRKRTILVICTGFFSQCSGNSLISFYIVQILRTIGVVNPVHQAVFNGCLVTWAFLVAIAFSFMVDKFGRRTLFLTAAAGMLTSFTIWTALSAKYESTGSRPYANGVLAMIFLFSTSASVAWPGLTVGYTAEILPYNIRAKGLTLCFWVIGLAGIFNQYVNPIGIEHLRWKFYFVYIAILVIEFLVIYFYYVETKGLSLEEVAKVFDGENATVPAVAMSTAVPEQMAKDESNSTTKRTTSQVVNES